MGLVKNENIELNKNEIEVCVDAEIFDKAVDKVYKKNSKKINVPGFRTGKAPRKVIERRYGEKIFYDDAIELVYPSALEDAIKEANLDVVAVESLETIEVDTKKGFSFKAVCILKPEVELSDYKGIEVEKPIRVVDDKAVDKRLQAMRERAGRLITVEDRASMDGDMVVIDFEGFVDDKPFEGGKAQKHTLKLGSGSFIPGFEEQVVGKNVGDEFDVNVTFPKDYHAENLKGKPALFKCKLHEIKKVELPEQDDEFAKDVSEFDTLKELKDDIRSKMEKEAQDAANIAVESELTTKLVEKMKADIPSIMFEKRVDDLMRDFEHRISMQGLTLDLYAQYTGMDKESIKGQFEEQAKSQVKTRLALEKIVSLEDIKVSDEEFAQELKKLADQYKMEIEKIKTMIPQDDLKSDIAINKAMKFVKDNAKITEKIVEGEVTQ